MEVYTSETLNTNSNAVCTYTYRIFSGGAQAHAQAHGVDASTHSDQCPGDHARSSHVQNVLSECPSGPRERFPVPGIIRYTCKNTPKHTMHGIHLCIAVRLELIVLEMLLSLLIHLSIRAVAQHKKCHRNQKASDDRGHGK